MTGLIKTCLTGLLLCWTYSVWADRFDHTAWDRLLRDHVIMINQGRASQVDYAAFLQERQGLQHYLRRLSAVSEKTFASWSKPEQLAFLINAYNAFTVELILTRYPKLDSIKDLGSFLRSPWKKEFVPLLGKMRSLDDIEHGMIRKPGVYSEPRIHFAVNCASIGCPALLNQAFVGEKLEQQFEIVTKAFLEDRTRNRYNASANRLELSKIFDWYTEDFESGWGGWHSLNQFLAHYADSLTDNEQDRQMVAAGGFKIRYLDYDWKLNETQ
ncbi:DUF547 domain-containing protein [Nitrosomonas sp.]|uniref:DUF547 domain-containing protein n=1 Tax=Nitrosomonas sp. TaxID=42353 RepID=UPI001D9F9976|nr:DUF547 domain-containing protein [Nitrosomonas sp.]MCB1947423.1 DUF547 domain-containing protein [Nitrosomonas sp.]MCP5241871.1 DUF547 domain-containing protein [Burkholderiales bacterium]MDR4513204.1 DUF547 domain-containing protein [Nitrosomonas sp.]